MLDRKAELKGKYRQVYSVRDNDDQEYLFRGLSINEIVLVENFINRNISQFEIENYCLDTCLLHPENIDLDDVPPGVVNQICEEILTVSGITDSAYIINALGAARESLSGDIIVDIKTYIISAIPAYSDEDLDKFTLLQLIEKLVLSEKILQLQANLSGLEAEIKLDFQIEQQEEESTQSKAPSGPTPSKEELLRRIKKDNKESQSSFGAYHNPNAVKEFEGFDEQLLAKMEGRVDPNDPIARKLLGG